MHKQRNGSLMSTNKSWKLTLTQKTPPTVLTGLSDDQMRRAVRALMTGDDRVIDELLAETFAAPMQLAA
jgi:hypothetical protein